MSIARLRPYNAAAGILHLVQAVLIVVLANSFALPVNATYMTGPPGACLLYTSDAADE